MTSIKELFYGIFVLSFICGIYRLLAVKNSAYATQIQFGAGLLSIALLCVPVVKDFSFSLPDFQYQDFVAEEKAQEWQTVLLQESKAQLDDQWQSALCEKFSLQKTQCRVDCQLALEEDTVFCRKMTVTVTKNHAYKTQDIQRYLERYCDTEVIVCVWEGVA